MKRNNFNDGSKSIVFERQEQENGTGTLLEILAKAEKNVLDGEVASIMETFESIRRILKQSDC